MKFKIYQTTEYDNWFEDEIPKSQAQIEERLRKIRDEGHFGHIKDLDDDLFELKFNDGRRIYYTIIPVNNVILLLGGNKNGQNKDITKAKNSIQKARKGAKS